MAPLLSLARTKVRPAARTEACAAAAHLAGLGACGVVCRLLLFCLLGPQLKHQHSNTLDHSHAHYRVGSSASESVDWTTCGGLVARVGGSTSGSEMQMLGLDS